MCLKWIIILHFMKFFLHSMNFSDLKIVLFLVSCHNLKENIHLMLTTHLPLLKHLGNINMHTKSLIRRCITWKRNIDFLCSRMSLVFKIITNSKRCWLFRSNIINRWNNKENTMKDCSRHRRGICEHKKRRNLMPNGSNMKKSL